MFFKKKNSDQDCQLCSWNLTKEQGLSPLPQETMVELQIEEEEETEERAHRMRMEQLESESNAHGLQLEILEKRKEQLPPMGTIPSQQQREGESLPRLS